MAQLTLEQVRNSNIGESTYYVAYDNTNEQGVTTAGIWISPFFTELKEAKEWQSSYTGDKKTYCASVEKL